MQQPKQLQTEEYEIIDHQKEEEFFELFEDEMHSKVKEIEKMRDSVHKERQGLISVIEATVKETFSNK